MASTLNDFLLGRGSAPAPAVVTAAALGGYAYSALTPGQPARSDFRRDYAAAHVRHELIRRDLAPLIAAWRSAGIETLLFKGFHLASYVYPDRGARFHGDVDVLLPGTRLGDASRIARDLGWIEDWNGEELGLWYNHDAFVLRSPGGATYLDVHRFVIHSRSRWHPVQRRITAAVLAESEEREFGGTVVRVPSLVDALLVGVILQRCWLTDRWQLKPHDVLDFRLLLARGVTREALQRRAAELRCERTLQLFLERCDPERGRLTLAAPTPAEVQRWNRAVRDERRLLVGRKVERFLDAPAIAVDLVRAVPLVLRTWRALRRTLDLHQLLADATPPAAECRPEGHGGPRKRAVRGIRWCVRLVRALRPDPIGGCLLRSLCIYTELRRLGWPAIFVSGVRRDRGRVAGHAWVELFGAALPELGEPDNRAHYRILVRHPGAPTEPTS